MTLMKWLGRPELSFELNLWNQPKSRVSAGNGSPVAYPDVPFKKLVDFDLAIGKQKA